MDQTEEAEGKQLRLCVRLLLRKRGLPEDGVAPPPQELRREELSFASWLDQGDTGKAPESASPFT